MIQKLKKIDKVRKETFTLIIIFLFVGAVDFPNTEVGFWICLLVFFVVLLISIFLFLKPGILYSPKDFKNEENFMRALGVKRDSEVKTKKLKRKEKLESFKKRKLQNSKLIKLRRR